MNSGLLLSGGIDSISLAYWLKPNVAYTIDYGQVPAFAEIRSSIQVCKTLGIRHEIISIDCSSLGSGYLANKPDLKFSPSPEWWPYRNQLLVTLACMKGISDNLEELIIGSVKSDGFHKDGTLSFYEKLNALVQYQEGQIKISSPAINLSSEELVTVSQIPFDILLWAHSCHSANIACGNCPGCFKHLAVKQKLGIDE